MSPSSLTLSTGPKRLAASAAVVRAPSARPSALACSLDSGCRRIAPTASSVPVGVGHRRAVERRQRRQHARVELGHRASGQQVQQVAPRRRPRGAGCGPSSSMSSRSGDGDELRQRLHRPAQHHEERALPRVRQVERGAEQPLGQRRVADRRLPQRVLRRLVEQPPVGVAEAEDLRAFGEHLDLAARVEHDADVLAGHRGAGVPVVGLRARHVDGRGRAGMRRPSGRCRRCRAGGRCGSPGRRCAGHRPAGRSS